jgi:hypothetical protein
VARAHEELAGGHVRPRIVLVPEAAAL